MTRCKGYKFECRGWPVDQQVDYQLVRAAMNGMEFDIRVLQPWARDPAFYKSIWTEQSETPAHEGPTHHAIVDLWTYSFPLSHADEKRLAGAIAVVPPLLTQARANLTGNARDLWITGIGTMKTQVADLTTLEGTTAKSGPELKKSIAAAKQATRRPIGSRRPAANGKSKPESALTASPGCAQNIGLLQPWEAVFERVGKSHADHHWDDRP